MPIETSPAWEEMETLVFDRDDMDAALAAARIVLDGDTLVMGAPPSLIVYSVEGAVDGKRRDATESFVLDASDASGADAWLEAIPAQARAVLEAARRCAPAWPDAPRIPNAIAFPAAA